MHKDDALLSDLAQLARRQEEEGRQRFDERWDALAAGHTSADEQSLLLREARTDELARQAYEAFRPLGEDFQSTVVERIRTELGHSEEPPSLASVTPLKVTENQRPEIGERSHLPLGVHAWKPWALAATLILAIGALMVGLPTLQQQPLPAYQLSLDGMTQELRSGEVSGGDELPVFDQGNRLSLTLRPDQNLSGDVEPRFFLLRDGAFSVWSPTWEIAETGAIRVTGQVGEDLGLIAGDQELIVVLGRPSDLPNRETIRRQLEVSESPRGWILLRQPIHVRGGA